MFDPYAVRDQIGLMNMLAISGGRWYYEHRKYRDSPRALRL